MQTNKRQSISKKTRFEVFKRDSFTCQYCGNSAPEITLEIDHIVPVSKGGDNKIINLITSCFDCNRGKTNKLISDTSTVVIQKKQLIELNERKNQIEMMAKWKIGLLETQELEFKKFNEYYNYLTGYSVNEHGKPQIILSLKKYGYNKLTNALNISYQTYSKNNMDVVHEKIFSILNINEQKEKDPYVKDTYYLRKILINRFNYVDLKYAYNLIYLSLKKYDFSYIKKICVCSESWYDFKEIMESLDI